MFSTPKRRFFSADNGRTFPKTPSNLVALTFSDTEIDLTWNLTSANATSIKIERSQDDDSNFVEIDSIAGNLSSYNDNNGGLGLIPGTTYYYRIRGNNALGYSGYSNEAHSDTWTAIAQAYFVKIASLGPAASYTEKLAANNFIDNHQFVRQYLVSPASFPASLLCCISLTSLTAVNISSADWSTNGISIDGISQYLRGDTNYNTLSGVTITSASASTYGLGVGALFGCRHSDGTRQAWLWLGTAP